MHSRALALVAALCVPAASPASAASPLQAHPAPTEAAPVAAAPASAAPAPAAAAAPPAESAASVATAHAQYDLGAHLAGQLTDAVGIGITPLLGMGVLGAARWLAADAAARGALPWYQQPWFWSPLLAAVVVSWFGNRIPVVRRIMRAWKLWENKLAAILSIPVVASMAIVAVSGASGGTPAAHAPAAPAVGVLAEAAPLPVQWLAAIAACAVLLVVLVVKNAIDVLLLLSPFRPVDWILNGLKFVPLAVMLLASLLSAWLGAFVAVLIVAACALLFGWSLRLSVMGSVFARDILFLRWRRTPDPAAGFPAFASHGLRGVPKRTYGRIVRVDGHTVFRHRVLLVGPRRQAALPAGQVVVVRGMLFGPGLAVRAGPGARAHGVAWCAPAIRTHEELLAANVGAAEVLDCAVVRGFRAAWHWITGMFRGDGPDPAADAPAAPAA